MINRTIRGCFKGSKPVISLDNDTGSLVSRGYSCIVRIALNGINPSQKLNEMARRQVASPGIYDD